MQRTLLLFPLALFFTPATGTRDALRWKPVEGTFVRSFETTSRSELDSYDMLLDGEEQENPHAGQMEMTITTTSTSVFVDEIIATDDERATHFERTFQELTQKRTMESSMAPEPREAERISDLEEVTVVFQWNEDDEEYEIEFKTDEGLDDSLLEYLTEDATLRGFLPEDEVSEGDSWEVDIEAYVHAIWPGGIQSFYEEGTGPNEQRAQMNLALIEAVDGSIEATYQGTREEDGVRVAVIELEIEVTTAAEMEMEDERMGEFVQGVSLEHSLEGELLWDLEGQRMYAFTGESEGEEVNETTRTSEMPDGEEHEFTQRITYAGTTEYEFTLEEEE